MKLESINIGGKEIVRIGDGEIEIADTASREELKSAILYLISVVYRSESESAIPVDTFIIAGS